MSLNVSPEMKSTLLVADKSVIYQVVSSSLMVCNYVYTIQLL